jgi:transcriptional regulator with XRE-family HTH domain
MMRTPADLLRETRQTAGLTQAQLAKRVGTTQAGIARLERRGSNPTLATLERALRATGHRLELSAPAAPSSIDETLLYGTLRRTPAERLAMFTSWYQSVKSMVESARRSSGDLA